MRRAKLIAGAEFAFMVRSRSALIGVIAFVDNRGSNVPRAFSSRAREPRLKPNPNRRVI